MDVTTDMRDAWIELAHAVEPADAAVGRLLRHSDPRELLDRIRSGASTLRHEEGLAARLKGVSSRSAEDRADSIGARIITRADREWPLQIDDLGASAPMALWVSGAGDTRLLALRSLSVVGARACTVYGEELARSWAADLGAGGWTIISGAAFGIDGAAHRGALLADAITMAIVAGGVDVPYPRAHAGLLAAIADQGLVISEVPPGEPVRRQRFLSRNRLIAALGRATLVVEAAERSGTSATARAAAEMCRPVLAVPGPVTSPASAGCHRLVQDGQAILAAELADVVAALDLSASLALPPSAIDSKDQPAAPLSVARRDALDERDARVLDAMPARGWLDVDGLVRSSGLSVKDVLAAVSSLVALGWLEAGPSGWRRVREPAPRRTATLSG